jgi:very-short-patch-repair endonuclease
MDDAPKHQIVSPLLRGRARAMRREPTLCERKLWFLLRDRRLQHLKFRRQVPLGRYILDFACFNPKVVVEADGGQHAENAHDHVRDRWLTGQGFIVLRYWNADILDNPDGVLTDILHKIGRDWT